jgi:ubiquinone/menaquinone biosynthesis C-methylase UbiE
MHSISRSTLGLVFAVLTAVVVWTPATPASQRASRPAAEWISVLDAPERIAGMKIPEVVTALALEPGQVVADLGAGSGPFVIPLARAVGPTGRVYAVEIDRDFLPHIQRKVIDAGVTTVQALLGEPSDPKLPGAVDLAFLHDVLHHIDDRPEYFRNLAAYLTRTSRVAIVDYHPADSPHANEPALQVSREQAAEWLGAIGFRPVREVPLFREKYFVIYGR